MKHYTKKNFLGYDKAHLFNVEEKFLLHGDAIQNFLNLKKRCRDEGFNLSIASSFRSFERQRTIWNEKALGERPLLDVNGHEVNWSSLSKEEVLFHILRWSAIPGFSRHHWGTEIDVYCKKSMPENYKLQLSPEEVSDQGIFGPLHIFLDELIKNDESFGFFRPYCEDLGGVSPERWHLSYAPAAKEFEAMNSLEFFEEEIASCDIELKDLILDHSKDIFKRFIVNTCPPPSA